MEISPDTNATSRGSRRAPRLAGIIRQVAARGAAGGPNEAGQLGTQKKFTSALPTIFRFWHDVPHSSTAS